MFSFPFCLTDQPTDPPNVARKGVMGGGGVEKGETFSYWGIKGLNFSVLLAFNPGYALILLAQALCVFRLQTLCVGQTHSALFNNLEHDVEQGGQTNSTLLFTPENIEKVESKLQNFVEQGGTPENKRKVTKRVKFNSVDRC